MPSPIPPEAAPSNSEPSGPAIIPNVAAIAAVIVMLLLGAFTMMVRWSVDGLRAPQVAAAQE